MRNDDQVVGCGLDAVRYIPAEPLGSRCGCAGLVVEADVTEWVPSDWCDQEGARILAHMIQDYWLQKRKKVVAIKVVPTRGLKVSERDKGKVIYQVRSDMLNGYPR